jgi:hypothetical protein
MWKLLPGAFLGRCSSSGLRRLCPVHPVSCDDANPCTDDPLRPRRCAVDVCSQGACVGGPRRPGAPHARRRRLPALGGTFVGTNERLQLARGSCGTEQPLPRACVPLGAVVVGRSRPFQNLRHGNELRLRGCNVRSGSCTGSQLSCNDDGPCATSNLRPGLTHQANVTADRPTTSSSTDGTGQRNLLATT